MADALTGRTARRQLGLAQEAQRRQTQQLAEQERKLTAVETGQLALARGGGGGLLAYIDTPAGQDAAATSPLRRLFGGNAQAA